MIDERLQGVSDKLKLGAIKRHIFLCADQTKPKCASREDGLEVWDYLKKRIDELGLSDCGVFRSKANCLRVCLQGPIAVVYPEGIWYHSVDIPAIERIIQEHLVNGRVVREFLLAEPYIPVSNGKCSSIS